MAEFYDYTTFRLNSMFNNKYIARCPKCGKKGLRSVYPAKNGKQEIFFVHTAKQTIFGLETDKYCTIINEVNSNE